MIAFRRRLLSNAFVWSSCKKQVSNIWIWWILPVEKLRQRHMNINDLIRRGRTHPPPHLLSWTSISYVRLNHQSKHNRCHVIHDITSNTINGYPNNAANINSGHYVCVRMCNYYVGIIGREIHCVGYRDARHDSHTFFYKSGSSK